MSIGIACYNVHFGIGPDGQYNPARIAAEIGSADIICLQEVTRGLPDNGGADMVAELEALLPRRFAAVGMPVDIDAGSRMQETGPVSIRFQFGNMILSRWPFLSIRRHLLPRSRRAKGLNLQRGALEALIATPDGTLRVICAHLDHLDLDPLDLDRLVRVPLDLSNPTAQSASRPWEQQPTPCEFRYPTPRHAGGRRS